MANFVWGDGGAQLTPEAIASQRKVAQAMMQRGGDYSPIQSWTQGAARLAEGLVGGWESGRADVAERRNAAAERELLASLITGGATPAATPTVAAPAVAPVAAPAAVASPEGLPSDQASYPTPAAPAPAPTTFRPGIAAPAPTAAPDPTLPRGLRNNNPLNIEAGDFTKGQPGFLGSDGRFARFETPEQGTAAASKLLDTYERKYGLNTPAGIIGRWAPQGENNSAAYAATVAKKLGIGPGDVITPEMRPQLIAAMSEVENGRPAAVSQDPAALPPAAQPAQGFAVPGQPSPAVAQVAQAMPQSSARLMAAMASPYVSEGTKKVLGIMLTQQMKGGETDEIKEYNLDVAQRKARGEAPMSFFDFKSGLKKAGATNVTTNVDKGEDSFAKAAGTAQAKRYDDLAADGQQAQQMISDINTLTDLGKNIGTGKTAEFKAAIGPYAEALGVKVEGLSDIQAYEGIVNRVAPTLRVKGSGAQSDYELKNFLKSLPALGSTPEGNAISAATMKGLQENKVLAAEIGAKALNREITRTEAEKQLRSLPDPMTQYREYMKANRGAPTAVGAKTTPAIPQPGEIRDGFRFKGGNPADQKNWEQIS